MGKAAKYAGLVALLIGARYAPLDRMVTGLLWSSNPPANPVVTGSVEQPSATPHASASTRKPDKIEAKVQSILAGAAESPRSNSRGGNNDGPRSRVRTDEIITDSDGIYTGGTGLIEEAVEDNNKVSKALVAANPDDYLVICEAGCRPSNDRIVYRVSKIAAAATAIAQRRLEVTSVQPKQADEGESTGVVCVAGCYDEEPAPRKQHTDRKQNDSIKLAQVEETASPKIAQPADAKPSPAGLSAQPVHAEVRHAAIAPDDKSAAETAAAGPAQFASQAQAFASNASAQDLSAAHLISAETAAHLAAKNSRQAQAAVPASAPRPVISAVSQSRWRTKVTSIVALHKDAQPQRSIVALAPFETSIAVENGWEGTLVNTQ